MYFESFKTELGEKLGDYMLGNRRIPRNHEGLQSLQLCRAHHVVAKGLGIDMGIPKFEVLQIWTSNHEFQHFLRRLGRYVLYNRMTQHAL